MPRAAKTTEEPSAVETEAVTDALEAAVEDLEGDEAGEQPATVPPCISLNCQHFVTDIFDHDDGDDQPARYLCSAIPDEPPTELDFDLQAPEYVQPCIAPTLMKQIESWEKLAEDPDGQLKADLETPADKYARVRERLVENIRTAQAAVDRASTKLYEARDKRREEEELLQAFDEAQDEDSKALIERSDGLDEACEVAASELPGCDEDVPGDSEPLDDEGGDETS